MSIKGKFKMNIFLTADFLMTSESEQRSNLKWIHDLLRRPVSIKGNNNVSIFLLTEFLEGSSRYEFFNTLGLDFDEKKTQLFFSINDIDTTTLDYVSNILKDCDLIIGYELSEQTRYILDQINVKYIDIWLHPIRYLNDVMFGVHSNSSSINQRIKDYAINEELFYINADMLKVQNYRGFRRFKNNLIPDSALFVGQTLTDKAIFSEGKMLSVLDFKSEFKDAAKKYERVYYSRHPFVKEGDDEIISFLNRFPNVEVVSSPTYNLLAAKEIEYVFTVSSSVVHEAHYFGKESKFLFKPVFHTFGEAQKYYPIMHAIFFEDFWNSVLYGMTTNNWNMYLGDNKIRDTLSFYWGYRKIDKLESLKETVSFIFKKISK